MGLIHSRASKKQAEAQAKLADAERKVVNQQLKDAKKQSRQATSTQHEQAAGQPWYRQPTLGAAIKAAATKHQDVGE
jgi:hypothetical protein